MAIKPILFNTEMIQAIMDGRKTCTRRILKGAIPFDEKAEYWNVLKKGEWSGPICVEYFIKQGSPYQPGDILYVRETWHKYTKLVGKGEGCHLEEHYGYKASIANSEDAEEPWKPSIHMPKKAARIWLKVTNVSVERLQDITEDGAEAEGCFDYTSTALGFPDVWDSTIKKSDLDSYGWDANPYVFVIEFVKIDKPEEIQNA